jgi:hypothetical protein
MPRSFREKMPVSTATLQLGPKAAASVEVNPLRAGMPALDSILQHSTLPSRKPGGPSYRILRTNETDSYEQPAPAAPLGPAALPLSDDFAGTARKAAKLTVATARTTNYTDLQRLIASLPAEILMTKHKPPITTGAGSGRVNEEQRNVQVKAFLYAASREADNDFHLIVGRSPHAGPEMYMTMEISGLPPATSAFFAKLKAARDAYKTFFGAKLPGGTYDFYDPPISIRIGGSLFFDMTHATGGRPGPQSLKSRMPTIWEVHPVTAIVFEP